MKQLNHLYIIGLSQIMSEYLLFNIVCLWDTLYCSSKLYMGCYKGVSGVSIGISEIVVDRSLDLQYFLKIKKSVFLQR